MKRALPALTYTILVDGKPVVALEARGREAAELCREEWFRSDLCALSSNGEAVCGIGIQTASSTRHRGTGTQKSRSIESS